MPNIFEDDLIVEQKKVNNIQNHRQGSPSNRRPRPRNLTHLQPVQRQKINWTKGLPKGRAELFSVTAILFMVMWLCGWQLLPFNKVNHLVVGNTRFAHANEVVAASGIRSLDSVKEVIANRESIEEQIVQANPIVSNIVFQRNSWKQLDMVVNEHQIVAIVQDGTRYFPLLENGDLLDVELNATQVKSDWQKVPLIDQVSQQGKLVATARALKNINAEVLENIAVVRMSTDLNKPNGLTLMMKDGMLVKAINSTLAEKINKYPKMRQLVGNQAGLINLEVGAYFTPEVANANSIKLDNNLDN
ncbi:cell division protein FtsQ/DivIB [Aerococcaceae bacterium zg-ZUI334]|uniref:cell division protein FtsQ/DivIB n=2 Tax=Aerococcaceae TaxID=186827 RepID=UPI0013CF5B41|nr:MULTISPECIES: cell division protein FtsQ/DivIB [unclassified Facklamia]MBR7928118.1 cell division protein FtsQ/DivIB [Aerococcaceae bacterium zg-ZUI334]QQD66189.1 cell division protein FtsQ/DivIB [Aerococcaceae bacterium zg-252]